MKPRTIYLTVILITSVTPTDGQGLAPRYWTFSSLADGEGTKIPWIDKGTSRYQQVYSAEMYRWYNLPPEGAFLNSIAFTSSCSAQRSWHLTNFDLRASTTPRSPDALSEIFQENVGPDEIGILTNRAELTIITDGRCDQHPPVGGILERSFFYNPSKGNLLLDFRNNGSRYSTFPGGPFPDEGRLQAGTQTGDWVSRAYASSVGATRAELVDTVGIYTEMIWVPLPRLRARNLTNEVELRWETHPREFRLQTSDSLEQPGVWWEFTAQIDENSDWRTIRIPASDLKKSALFRLFWNTPQPGVGDLQLPAVAIPADQVPPVK